MGERIEVIIRVKGIQNLKRLLLIILFGALSCYLSVRAVDAISQSERARLLTQTQKPGESQTKPAPKPTPTPGAAQPQKTEPPPAQEQNVSIKINSSLVAVPV